MPITPVELRNYQLSRKFRGYDPIEVESLIEEIATEMERMIENRCKLEVELESLKKKLATYENIEQSLKDSLLLAQQAAAETRTAAETEADSTRTVALREAETVKLGVQAQCDRIKATNQNEIDQLRQELAKLRMQKVNFVVELKSLVESHLKLIAELESARENRRQLELDTEQRTQTGEEHEQYLSPAD